MDKTNGCQITTIFLNEPFKNKSDIAPIVKVTAPDGHFAYFRQGGLTNNSQHVKMWMHCGCTVERIQEEREVRGCSVSTDKGFVDLEYGSERNILSYESADKPQASQRYNEIVKPALLKMGYSIEYHKCDTLVKSKKVTDNADNCLNGTIKSDEWNKV